jgi:hypothetical protein
MTGMSYAYVAIFGKPLVFSSNHQVQVDAPIHLLLYKGFISEADLAAVVKPLGAGDILCRFRRLADEEGGKVLCGEACTSTLDYQMSNGEEKVLGNTIKESIDAFTAVGSQPTWTLNNHDIVRAVSCS